MRRAAVRAGAAGPRARRRTGRRPARARAAGRTRARWRSAAASLTRAAAGLEEMWRRALSAYKGTDPTSDKQLLVDAIALPIFTDGPVDRVGVIRKLRLLPHHTDGPPNLRSSANLRRKESGAQTAGFECAVG